MLKAESYRISKYVLVGIGTTGVTWWLWNVLLWVIAPVSLDLQVKFVATQYLSAFLMILPSFWLHRYFAFRDKQHRSNKLVYITAQAYVVYIVSPLVASVLSYVFLLLFPDFLDTFTISLSNTTIAIGKYFLQFVGLVISVAGNYAGQRLWIYQR